MKQTPLQTARWFAKGWYRWLMARENGCHLKLLVRGMRAQSRMQLQELLEQNRQKLAPETRKD